MITHGASRPEDTSGTECASPTTCTLASLPPSNIFGSGPIEVHIRPECLTLYSAATETRMDVKYHDIVLHAASSEPSALYLQIEHADLSTDFLVRDTTLGGPDTEDGLWEEESSGMVELFLAPISSQHSSAVNDMFSALSHCASMHPDPERDVEGNEDGGEDGPGSAAHGFDFMNDPNHQWFTADDIDGQFADADADNVTNGTINGDQQQQHDQDEPEAEDGTDTPRKWRRTG